MPRIGLVYQRPRSVAFIRGHGAYGTASRRAWTIMISWLDQRRLLDQVTHGYGLAYDDPRRTEEAKLRYDACVELPRNYVELRSDGVCFQMLPGGAFARSRHLGSYTKLGQSVGRIRDGWMALQSHVRIDRCRPFMFTYFDLPQACGEDELRTDVCIPVSSGCTDFVPRAAPRQPPAF